MAHIIVIDDESSIRRLIRHVLENVGHRVTDFPDAAPALKSTELHQADLVITDLSMPTPGEWGIRMMRTMDIATPIMVMSGELTSEKIESLRQLQVSAYIAKPFSIHEFTEKIPHLLNKTYQAEYKPSR